MKRYPPGNGDLNVSWDDMKDWNRQDRNRDSSKPKSAEKEAEGFKGLCMNCAHREICLYPKPEGGVWHCEEYEEEK
ncbi:MAG: hypothetical protein ACYTG7_03225 [Planctomycetota bacterium]